MQPSDDLKYLLACVEQHADKFPVPSHMLQRVANIRRALSRPGADGEAVAEEIADALARASGHEPTDCKHGSGGTGDMGPSFECHVTWREHFMPEARRLSALASPPAPVTEAMVEVGYAEYCTRTGLFRTNERDARGKEAFRAALTAALASAGNVVEGWKPIDTAPSNDFQGKVLIVGGAWPEPTIVKNDGDWWRYRKREGSIGVPTHWQPLPAAPSQGTENE